MINRSVYLQMAEEAGRLDDVVEIGIDSDQLLDPSELLCHTVIIGKAGSAKTSSCFTEMFGSLPHSGGSDKEGFWWQSQERLMRNAKAALRRANEEEAEDDRRNR